MLEIGPYRLSGKLILAPMAGVTDLPFRKLCRSQGAAMAVSEMVIADPKLWKTRKSSHRLDHRGEPGPISVQIAGSEPAMLAEAARLNVEKGAQIIDINLGCPAKKVCNKAAGSALMRDEPLVRDILKAVVGAVNVPVTLKMRTGWDQQHKNALEIARMAEDIGVSAVAIHGRTRACGYRGSAEYDTIAEVKSRLSIPVLANGDINSPAKAHFVLDYTKADGLLIGRAAQGNPWIFREINHFLKTGQLLPAVSAETTKQVLLSHLHALHAFYGDVMGVRIARKHVSWYMAHHQMDTCHRQHFNQLQSPVEQTEAIEALFDRLLESTGASLDTQTKNSIKTNNEEEKAA